MTSLREQILGAIATRVHNGAGITVHRSREAPVTRAEGIVAIVHPIEETVAKTSPSTVVRDLNVGVIFLARGPVPDTALDPVIASALVAVMADQTLGGLANQIIEDSTRWNFQEADSTALAAEINFKVRYLTPPGSIAALA